MWRVASAHWSASCAQVFNAVKFTKRGHILVKLRVLGGGDSISSPEFEPVVTKAHNIPATLERVEGLGGGEGSPFAQNRDATEAYAQIPGGGEMREDGGNCGEGEETMGEGSGSLHEDGGGALVAEVRGKGGRNSGGVRRKRGQQREGGPKTAGRKKGKVGGGEVEAGRMAWKEGEMRGEWMKQQAGSLYEEEEEVVGLKIDHDTRTGGASAPDSIWLQVEVEDSGIGKGQG